MAGIRVVGANPIDHGAPLPLGYVQALERGKALHALGPSWSWRTIADVMREYHGFDRSAGWWRRELRGHVSSRARGGSFTASGDRAA
jgi:hypothetical protein